MLKGYSKGYKILFILIFSLVLITCVITLSYAYFLATINNSMNITGTISSQEPSSGFHLESLTEGNLSIEIKANETVAGGDSYVFIQSFDLLQRIVYPENVNTASCTYDIVILWDEECDYNNRDFFIMVKDPSNILYGGHFHFARFYSANYSYLLSVRLNNSPQLDQIDKGSFDLYFDNDSNRDQSYLLNYVIKGKVTAENLHCEVDTYK